MKVKLALACSISVGYLAAISCLLLDAPKYEGGISLLRFDPNVSSDYNCVFVEGHSVVDHTIPWLRYNTPIQFLRIRYTPKNTNQSYGVMFIDPKTLAFKAHAGFAHHPGELKGRLNSPNIIRDWMQSQPNSAEVPAHEEGAKEIYGAIVALARTDLEHFVLPGELSMSHFRIGHTSLVERNVTPPGLISLLILIGVWLIVFGCMSKRPRDIQMPAKPPA